MMPETLMIVVSMLGTRADTMEMLNQGAIGNVPGTATENGLCTIASIVLTGGSCLPKTFSGSYDTVVETVADMAPPLVMDGGPARRRGALNNRQSDGLALLAQGKSNTEIGAPLGLSDKAGRIYLLVILKTLNVQTQTTRTGSRAAGQSAASCHAGP